MVNLIRLLSCIIQAPSGAATTEEAAKKTATGKADKAEDGYDSEEEKQAVLEEENIQLPVVSL